MQSAEELASVLQTLKTTGVDRSASTNSPEESEDGFYLVEDTDYVESIDFSSFSWLDPNHPLYFPTMDASTTKTSRWEAVDKFSVENWYPHLKKHTFASHFITLTYEDILFLMGNSPSEYDSSRLETTFSEVLSTFSNKQAFMRLSTRSPKDSSLLFDEASTLMSKDETYWPETDNKNQQLVSFVTSMLQAMKIKDGKKISELIQQSPRVFGDLLALVSTVEPAKCTTNIILREWHDIRPDHEFRLFVSRRNRTESVVTAISQYFHFLYFDKTPGDCFNFLDESTKEALIAKFTHYVLRAVDPDVAKFLNFSREQDEDDTAKCIREYIIDLALVPLSQYHGELLEDNTITIGDNTYALMVIELNPFAPAATGSGLFNWKNELMTLWGKTSADYPIFRQRTTPREDLSAVTLLPANYESVIKTALTKRLALSKPLEPSLAYQRDRLFTHEQPMAEAPKNLKKQEKTENLGLTTF
jgi:hypothetical protein